MKRISYPRTSSSSEGSLESIICHASQDESTTQKQPWSKEKIEVALSTLPGGDIVLSLIPTLHGNALQKVLEEFQCIRKFLVLNLLFHLIFVAFFSGFVCATYLWHDEQLSRVLFWPLLTITCLFASKEMFQITCGIYYYTKRWGNWLQWSVIVASGIILIPPARLWQHHVAALGILLVWIDLVIVIGYFPIFGLYAQMFMRVFINFSTFLAAYFCLIIGFTFSFNMLKDDNDKFFNDPLISLLKVVIMMSGGLEFVDVFFSKEAPLKYPGTAHLMLLCFAISVILMNLMVGLAVSDIQELRKRADLERMVHQAEIINGFENMLFSTSFHYTLPNKIIQACIKNTLLFHPPYHYALYIRPNDPREKCLPRELIYSLYRLAGEQKMRRATFRGAPPQNVAANESQQELDELVAELKEYSHDISIRLDSLTSKIKRRGSVATPSTSKKTEKELDPSIESHYPRCGATK